MSDAGHTERCTRCAAEFAASSPLGLCPACLLKLGMSDPALPAPSEVPEKVEPPVTVAPLPPLPTLHRRLTAWYLWATAAVILLIVLVVLGVFARVVTPRQEVMHAHRLPVRFNLMLPDGTELLNGAQFAVSPDGAQVVVAARSARGGDRFQRLWVRRLESPSWRELPRTEGAALPFWSPDSQHIGFFAERRLKRIDISGGLVTSLCDVPFAVGGTWSPQGAIVFASGAGLMRVSASGGSPELVTHADGGGLHLWPQFLPDSRQLIFMTREGNRRSTHLTDMNTGESRMVAEGGGPATSIASILLFLRGNTLVAQGFDPARGLLGDPQSIGGAEDIENSVQAGPQFSASSTVLVYRPRLNRRSQLAWLDREGRHIGTIGDVGDYEDVAISPTGRSLAVTRRDGPNDTASLWRIDVGSDRIERLTPGSSHDPVWSPDGTRVAYRSERDNRDSTVGLYATSAEGGGTEDVLLRSNESKRPTDWSKDGRVLIYTMRSPKTGTDVWALPTMGDAQPFPVVQTAGNDSRGVLSPDGRWIAYASDESGSEEVYVRAFPPSNGRWQISSSGGTQPRWRADGRELFYLSEEGAVTSVDISTGREGTDKPTLRIGVPRMLFEIHGADDFAVSPDGRFLVSMSLDDSSDPALEVVLNWASDLRLPSH